MTLAGFYGGSHKGSVFGYSAQYGDDYHWGQDIKGHPEGTPIPALAAGTVAQAGWQSAHGWYISVDTGDGWFDTYSHMVSLWHDVGAWLEQGASVGPLGTTGLSTGPHLHTQRTRNPFPWSHGTEVDPWPRIVNTITGTSGGGLNPFDPEEDDMIDSMFAVVDGVPSWCWLNWGTGKVLAVHTQEEADWVGGYMGSVRDNWANDAIGGDKYKNKLAMLGILGPARIEITAPGGQVDYDRIRSMIDAGVAGAFDGLELKVSRA